MGPKVACAHPHRAFARKAPCGAQHAQLCLLLQPVAGFHLDRRQPLGDHRIQPGQRLRDQIVLACRARGADGGQDAAPCPRDLFVACALKAHLEFPRAVAAKDDVAVTVDRRGRDQPPAQIAARGLRMIAGQVALGPDPEDAPALQHDRTRLDQPIAGAVQCGKARVAKDFSCHLRPCECVALVLCAFNCNMYAHIFSVNTQNPRGEP